MADTPETQATPNGADAQQQMRFRQLAQFVRDLSFENVMAQKGVKGEVKPEMSIRVALDARPRAENQFEVLQKLNITSINKEGGDTLFEIEIEYVGIFEISGLPEDQMHPFLMIECPRMMFPYIRRVVSDLTQDGGFPAFNMDQIDYVALYRNELARRQQAQAEGGDAPAQA
ncbi:MAG: protein-export chaperone SecB [Rhodobacterales bacterium]|nr:MAG: protein-export chaperone SecB [Rhodobacterales bacterium]